MHVSMEISIDISMQRHMYTSMHKFIDISYIHCISSDVTMEVAMGGMSMDVSMYRFMSEDVCRDKYIHISANEHRICTLNYDKLRECCQSYNKYFQNESPEKIT